MTTPQGNLPRLMGIFAHPDDESFGMAGTLNRSTRTGHPTAIVCATRGEEGKIAEASQATQDTLGQVRERELRAACAAVGVSDVTFLDYVDGHLSEADPHEAVGRIVRQIRRFRPDVVVTMEKNGGYGHVDHMAIHRLTLAAIEAAADPQQYPDLIGQALVESGNTQARYDMQPHRVTKVYYNAIPRERLIEMTKEARARGQADFIPGGDEATLPIEEMGTPMSEVTTFIQLDEEDYQGKRRSMTAHATQMPADSPFSQASDAELRQVMGTETFQVAQPPVSARSFPTPENDLFAGLTQHSEG